MSKKLKIEYVNPSKLKSFVNNPRTHSDKQKKQLSVSIETFGFTNPLLVDENYRVIAGHGRLEAAKLLKLKQVPVIKLEGLDTETKKRAYLIADNKLGDLSSFDNDLLKEHLEFCVNDINFDIELTGFSTTEIDLIIEDDLSTPKDNEKEFSDDPEELVEGDLDVPLVSQLGDLWIIDKKHKLLCSDALKEESYSGLLKADKASMIFTDPPYNVPINGHVCGKGKTKHDEFAMASGEMSTKQFGGFLGGYISLCIKFSTDGSIHYHCMDWRHAQDILAAATPLYTELKNICIWNKTNGGMGTFYRNKHEMVFVFKNGKGKHINNFELGQTGRYRTNVWDYPGVNSFSRKDDLKLHPTVKPIGLVADAIRDCSKINDIILDPFAGSGTILLACERTKRRATAIELDPKYVDVAINRYLRVYPDAEVIHAETGKSYAEIADLRTPNTAEA